MLHVMLRTWGLTVLIGVLGALLGFGLELIVGQAGWLLVGASLGLCVGAILGGSLMNPPPAPAVAPAVADAPPADPAE
jgi:ABC-type branched-subunit amino acid transport system permease subunit